MIWLSRIHLIAIILHCCSPTAFAEKDADSSENREGLIQEAVKSFLGVRDSLEQRVDSKKKHPDPPRYMLDLYRSYKKGQMPTQGNTVRSILSMRGRTENVEMLVFNLTGIQATEQILQGRLHLYVRRRPKNHKRKDSGQYRLKVMDLVAPNHAQVINITLRQKQGWKSFDVTKAVIKCRSVQRNGDYLLTVSAESLRPNGKYRATSLKKLLRLTSQPFLIIFSEDRNNRNEAEDPTDKDTVTIIEELLRQVRNDSDRKNPLTAKDVITERRKRSVSETGDILNIKHESSGHATSVIPRPKEGEIISDNTSNHLPSGSVGSDHVSKAYMNSVLETMFRLTPAFIRNDSFTNDVLTIPEGNQSISSTHSHIKLDHRKLRKRLRRHWRRSLASNDVPYDTADTNAISELDKVYRKYSRKIDPNIIPLPRSMDEREMLPWHPRRKRRRKHRKLPFWWLKHEGKHMKHNLERVCQRKKLVVDFASIGWSEWVISPNSFESYYCAGRCSFPLIKNGRPSNHATIQSLVHAMNKDLHVPAPCCVPSTTSSLTLLYFDENRNVVLKNYPNMIVESCACR